MQRYAQEQFFQSSDSFCTLKTLHLCTTSEATCTTPPASQVLQLINEDIYVPLDPPRNYDFFLVAETYGLIRFYFPVSMNIYDCTQCPVTINPLKLNQNWIGTPPVLTLSYHNRTSTPILFNNLHEHFTTNDTVNCPVE
jgi:hypothetical protein